MTVLRTERLVLRPAGRADLATLLAHWDQPPVRRHLFDDRAVSPDLAAELLTASEADFAERGFGLWKVCQEGEVVGVCGLRGHGTGLVEILYSLEPARWGRGLATEAARAVLDAGWRTGLKEVLLETDEDNLASQRLAGRLGAAPTDAEDGLCRYILTPQPA